MAASFPRIVQVVLDTSDVRRLAEFYRELFGLDYRESDVPPPAGESDDQEWLVLRNPHGGPQLAFQQTDGVRPSTWPDATVPQMFHLDTVVDSKAELETQKGRALDLGASLLLDRSDDPDEPLYVFADPAGHPFCIFVG
jgi:catechol 2,3-dioxygenase-like lactoylglutathione lyase family enzyme